MSLGNVAPLCVESPNTPSIAASNGDRLEPIAERQRDVRFDGYPCSQLTLLLGWRNTSTPAKASQQTKAMVRQSAYLAQMRALSLPARAGASARLCPASTPKKNRPSASGGLERVFMYCVGPPKYFNDISSATMRMAQRLLCHFRMRGMRKGKRK
eukprot:CAMPEP_0115375250 /NCGR_PEP_ID=MMETSP0271-20121206/2365_1 /TAXON_ID=71861 /ORGANISM="Scrippsiella trochoidea, Strain CCMP3099" /LENGTH=154 /DNA_ID=CAMNT_0002798307 /DNA_START=1003 /DNA_END=1468 /DNA_ORIENTATION=-